MVLVVYALNVLEFSFFFYLFAGSKAYSIACFGVDIFMMIFAYMLGLYCCGAFFNMGVDLYYYP